MNKSTLLIISLTLTVSCAFGQVKDVPPPSPEYIRLSNEVMTLTKKADEMASAGNLDVAVPLYEKAMALDESIEEVGGMAAYHYGRALLNAGRYAESAKAYNRLFRWDSGKQKPFHSSGGVVSYCMEYAIALSELGRVDEAKAIYHYGLSRFNGPKSREREPLPFLVVFASEPDGIEWEYTKQNLKVAALMLRLQDYSIHTKDIDKVRRLAPNWFYPLIWLANQDGRRSEDCLAQAKALVKPNEQKLLEQYLSEREEHKAHLQQTGGTYSDKRPMTRGVEIRSRMKCLDPDNSVLKSMFKQRTKSAPASAAAAKAGPER